MASDTSQFTTMAQLAGVAALLVSPYAWLKGRQIRRDRSTRRELTTPPPPPTPEPMGADDLERVIDELGLIRPGDERLIPLPQRPRIDGHPTPDDVAWALILDAARRSKVEIVERTGTELRCRRESTGSPRA